MDTSSKKPTAMDHEAKARVDAQLKVIKDHMPETYAAIQAKSDAIGGAAFRFVRHGLGGVPNRFYAMERGHVVGTPFDMPDVNAEMARYICQFGAKHWIMWSLEAQALPIEEGEASHGQG